jgi:AI-2 transport system permease protein
MIQWKWLRSWEAVLAAALVVELLVLGAINPAFLSVENLLYSTSDFAHVILGALGLTLVVITAGIDISGVSIMGLASIVLGLSWVAGVDIWVAVLIALAVGSLAGAFNGLLVANTDVNPLVLTLGSMFMFAGVATGLPGVLDLLGFKAYGAGGFAAYQYEGITGLPKEFTALAHGGVGWVPNPLIAVLLFALALSAILHRTRFGRYLYLIGVNPNVARYSGVPVKSAIVAVYMLSAFGAAMAGVILTSYFTSARSDLGSEALLNIITAVVLGGTDILGGSGTVLGTLLAGLVLGFLRQGLLALGVSNDVIPIIVGGLLVGTVAVKLGLIAFNQKRGNRRAYQLEISETREGGGSPA